ncbi:protein S100-A11 [Chaetodon trifascialis]|uniref:protein S100-A11 n=1 Tax=Chaetodon trifascialis TaxID=109706 RepID=UPI0039948E48
MCASVSGDEAYILREVAVRVEGHGSWYHLSISALKTSAQATMEAAIRTLVTEFKTYAGKDGSSSTLSKDEFHKLVVCQLPNFVKNASDAGAIEQLMSSLDENNDRELTFSEFWQLIGKLASEQGGFS